MALYNQLENIFKLKTISNYLVITILIVSLMLGIYECISYVLISKKQLNNKSILIAIALIPSFISTIVFCLQQNTVITLGTIGALAIIRFRNAIKEPIDIVYLLWSVHSGIMVGCQLYPIAIYTSVLVTIVLLGFEIINVSSRKYTVVIKTNKPVTEEYFKILLCKTVKKYKIEARNYSNNSHDYILEIKTKNIDTLDECLSIDNTIISYSILDSQRGE